MPSSREPCLDADEDDDGSTPAVYVCKSKWVKIKADKINICGDRFTT